MPPRFLGNIAEEQHIKQETKLKEQKLVEKFEMTDKSQEKKESMII